MNQSDECTCAVNKMADGTDLTMLRDPSCPQHGDKAREREAEDPERWDGMS